MSRVRLWFREPRSIYFETEVESSKNDLQKWVVQPEERKKKGLKGCLDQIGYGTIRTQMSHAPRNESPSRKQKLDTDGEGRRFQKSTRALYTHRQDRNTQNVMS